MNTEKEKSAVGVGAPATEIDKQSTDIISENEEKIKAQNAYKKRISGQDAKIANFIVKQKQSYEFKVKYAELRIREFIRECDLRGLNTHVSVGGLDSITLFMFIKSLGINVLGISVSVLEDKTIQAVHKDLGLERLKPYKNKVSVIREFGFPVLSKEVASKIELLQNPSENNKTVRHAIITGETGAYGGYRTNTRMKLAQRWLELFGGYENENEGVNYKIPPFRVSSKCCYYLKEKPADDWAKKHNSVPFLGLMASEGGRRQKSLMLNGCNYFGKSTIRSAPFAIFNRSDLLRLALELKVPVPEIYGEIKQKEDGTYYTTKAQRTGCSMCGFGIQLEKRPHRFDYLRQTNPSEWAFWMYRCCIDGNGRPYGWGRVLDYIGVSWEDDAFAQLTFGGEVV